jgi:hypothetical protein
MEFLITAVVAVNLLFGMVSACPVCECHRFSHGVTIYCLSAGLDSFPTDVPNNTEIL